MKKYIIIGLIIGMTGLAAAQPLTDFTVEKGFASNFVGGETQQVEMSFSSTANTEIPVYVRLNVSSDKPVTGEEFTINAEVNSTNSTDFRYTELSCYSLLGEQYSYRDNERNLVYSCYSDGDEILPGSDNKLNLTLETDTAIAPADFNFELDVLTRIGHVDDKSTVQNTFSDSIEFGESAVSFESEQTVDVTAWRYNSLMTDSPDGKQFIGGVDVLVTPSSQRAGRCYPFIGDDLRGALDDYVQESGYWFDRVQCREPMDSANGTLRFNFSDDIQDGTVQIYRYNLSEAAWEAVDEQSVDANNDFVAASITGFSSYAAFGEPESSSENGNGDNNDDTNDDGGGGFTASSGGNEIPGTGEGDGETENSPPEADFSYIQYEDTLIVQFSSESTDSDGSIESVEWSFGDGETATGEVVNHTYSSEGIYEINITVTDNSGASDFESETIEILPVTQESTSETEGGTTEQDDNTGTTGPTGQFAANPTTWWPWLILLILVAALVYRYREELTERVQTLR